MTTWATCKLELRWTPAVASPLQATTWGYDGISENGSDIAQYDNQDRLLIWKNNSYSYNLAGDLRSASTPSGTTNDQYNALGNLTQVQLPTGSTIAYQAVEIPGRAASHDWHELSIGTSGVCLRLKSMLPKPIRPPPIGHFNRGKPEKGYFNSLVVDAGAAL